ncbi:MAG TPA: hypothetical protein VFF65_10550, partial [Phycisphaerales bacterium]|nr:hypothetical protein [Phycisphaerales bacterium]
MTSVFAAACAVLGAGAAALGQFAGGVNIDFNSAVGSGAGQPTVLFPGAAGQGGYWNPVNPPFTHLSSRAIRNLGNSADAVFCLFLTSAGGTGTASADNPATSGDAELLFDDVHNLGGTGSTVTYSIGAFAPGVYEVYTYAVAPDDAAYLTRIGVRTNGDGAAADRVVGGVIPAGGVLTEGVTHARHTVVLSAAGP